MKTSNAARLLAVLAALAWGTAGAVTITPTHFTAPPPGFGGTIGFAYVGDGFVGSVQADGTGNVLYRTDLNGGSVTPFASTVNIPGGSPSSEHYVASSLGLAGFPTRDVYVAAGNGIIHINHAGTTGAQFITSVNGAAGNQLASAVRGILFDPVGTVFGGDMLVTTNGGQIYRVTSSGAATLLASTGEDTEGLDIAPAGSSLGHAGELFVASEGSGLIRIINAAGTVTELNPNNRIPSTEELTFVPLNLGASGSPVEGFYGADYTPDVVKAPASQFLSLLGDIIVTGESTHVIWDVHGGPLTIAQVGGFPNQPEDGIFVTQAIVNPCTVTNTCVAGVDEPRSTWLLGAGLLALIIVGRSRRSNRGQAA